jgi:hypothetical protein
MSEADDRRPWTKDEDVQVVALVREHGTKSWSLVGSSLYNRSGKQVRRFMSSPLSDTRALGRCIRSRVVDPIGGRFVHVPWNAARGRALGVAYTFLLARHTHTNTHAHTHTSRQPTAYNKQPTNKQQCRERWHNHLNPVLKKESWTRHEDQVSTYTRDVERRSFSSVRVVCAHAPSTRPSSRCVGPSRVVVIV